MEPEKEPESLTIMTTGLLDYAWGHPVRCPQVSADGPDITSF